MTTINDHCSSRPDSWSTKVAVGCGGEKGLSLPSLLKIVFTFLWVNFRKPTHWYWPKNGVFFCWQKRCFRRKIWFLCIFAYGPSVKRGVPPFPLFQAKMLSLFLGSIITLGWPLLNWNIQDISIWHVYFLWESLHCLKLDLVRLLKPDPIAQSFSVSGTKYMCYKFSLHVL